MEHSGIARPPQMGAGTETSQAIAFAQRYGLLPPMSDAAMPDVAAILQDAVESSRLEQVAAQAGQRGISEDAKQALREATAAAIAQRLARTSRNQPDWEWHAPAVTPLLLAEARCAILPPTLAVALQRAGFATGALRPEAVHQAMALELAATTRHAAQIATQRGVPVDRGCVIEAAEQQAAERQSTAADGIAWY